jgi:hypothetical protein
LLQVASLSDRLSLLSLDFGVDGTDDYINAAVKDFGDFQEGSFTISRESILLGENGLDGLLDIFSFFLDAIDPPKFDQYHELYDMFVALSSAIARRASNARKVRLYLTSTFVFLTIFQNGTKEKRGGTKEGASKESGSKSYTTRQKNQTK